NRKNAFKNALETCIVSFAGQKVHLQKSLVGLLLNFDQVGNRNRSFDLRKINSFTMLDAIFRGLHSLKSSKKQREPLREATPPESTRSKTKRPEGEHTPRASNGNAVRTAVQTSC